jgi:hypothetical protein
MSPYWAAVAVMLVPLGAVFKYLVWDFFHKVQSLDAQYSTRIAEAHAAIHHRKFLPIIASIYDAIATRRVFLAASASTVEILTELSIDVKVTEAIAVVSEKVALDGAYRRARALSTWVAVPWLLSVGLFVFLFLGHYDAQVGIKSLWIPVLAVPTVLSGGLGCCTLTLYRLALNNFIRLLGTNPL